MGYGRDHRSRIPQSIATFRGPASRISNIAFSPDGNTIAATVWKNNELYLWSVTSSDRKIIPTGQTSIYTKLVFSPDGRTLVTAGSDGTVQVWDAISGENKLTFASILYWIEKCCVQSGWQHLRYRYLGRDNTLIGFSFHNRPRTNARRAAAVDSA